MAVLKIDENGRWKEKLCWVIQESSVTSQVGADEDCGYEDSADEDCGDEASAEENNTDENSADEDGFAVTIMAG